MYSYAATLVVWLLFTVFTNTLVEAGCYNYGQNRGSQVNLIDAGWPDPGDGVVERCFGGYDWEVYNKTPPEEFYPIYAEISFQLPVNYVLLYLITRGGANIGGVTVVNSNVVKNTADVLVHVGYYTQEALNHVNVCQLNRGDNTRGLGIYTPADYFPSEAEGRMHFDVTVTFPATSDGKPLWIKDFQNTLDHYLYLIKDMKDKVYFDYITVRADAAGINSEAVFAGIGTFVSTAGYVRGAYNVSNLYLTTTSGPIDVQVGHRTSGSYLTNLDLSTTDNPMQSTFSGDAQAAGGSFSVTAQTTRGPITILYTNAPVDSVQNFVATTDQGSPVTVSMSSTYEGDFILDTTGNNPITVNKSGAKDPSGQGRERYLYTNPQGTHADGVVYWDPIGSGSGWRESRILIRTDKAPIRLTV